MKPEDICFIPLLLSLAIFVWAVRFLEKDKRYLRGIAFIVGGLLGCLYLWMELALAGKVYRLMYCIYPFCIVLGFCNFFPPPYKGAEIFEYSRVAQGIMLIGFLCCAGLSVFLNLNPDVLSQLVEWYKWLGLPNAK